MLRDGAHQFWPLLGFLVTDRRHQRRGIAESVLVETLCQKDALDMGELHVAVIPKNPAQTLYSRLGFAEAPPESR